MKHIGLDYLTTIAALQDRVKELEAERDAATEAAKTYCEMHREVSDSLGVIEAERDALKAADAWIDVRDAVPENMISVLALTKFGRQMVAAFDADPSAHWKWMSGGSSRFPLNFVTHWRPLPSPQKI